MDLAPAPAPALTSLAFATPGTAEKGSRAEPPVCWEAPSTVSATGWPVSTFVGTTAIAVGPGAAGGLAAVVAGVLEPPPSMA